MNLSNLKSKETTLPLNLVRRHFQVTDPLMRNVREETSYDRPEMDDSILNIGLTDPVWVVLDNAATPVADKLVKLATPIKGFSRIESLNRLAARFPDGYKMEDGTVRKFDTVRVKIVDTSDPMTLMILKMDHGMHKGLTRVEVFFAFEQLHMLQTKEKDMVVTLRGSIEANYPPDKKLPDAPSAVDAAGVAKPAAVFQKEYAAYQTKLLNHYKGVIQTFKRACDGPVVMRDAYVEKLKGNQKWPSNDELKDGLKIYEDEVTADTTASFSKINPGPTFTAWWDKLVGIKAEATANGETTRGKTNSAMNGQAIRELRKQANSTLMKRCLDVTTRDVNINQFPVLDKIALRLETLLTDDERAILAAMGAIKPDAKDDESKPTAETETPEADKADETLPV